MNQGNSPAVRALRWAMVGSGLALPVLSLVPLGSYWLWQRGLLISWAIARVHLDGAGLGGAALAAGAGQGRASWSRQPQADDRAGDATWTPAEHGRMGQGAGDRADVDPEQLETRAKI